MVRLRALAAALVLLLIVGAVPAALVQWGVSPLRLGGLLRPDDGSAVLAGLTLVAWAAWLAFTVSVLVEAVNVLGRRPLPVRIPLLGGMQSLAGTLVVAALSAVVVQPLASAHAASAPSLGATVVDEETTGSDAAATDTGYLVRPGDDLWSIAEQLLGAGAKWRLLADANPALLADPTLDLTAGLRLAVPKVASPAGQPGMEASEQFRPSPGVQPLTVVVERGDTLSGLAKEHLGDTGRWPTIFRANRDQIKDPDRIDVGWKLVVPGRRSAAPAPGQGRPVRKPAQPTGAQPTGAQPTGNPPTPAPGQPSAPSTPRANAPQDGAWPLIGGLSGAAAAMILAGVGAGRLDQLRVRPVGRRISHPPVDIRQYETALGRRQRPDTTALLEVALRTLGKHAQTTGIPLPHPRRVLLDAAGVTFEWPQAPATAPPKGFTGETNRWRLSQRTAGELPSSAHPVPFPALVTIGRDDDGRWLMIDLEARSPLALDGPRSLRHAAAAAMAVELSCSPWACELGLTVVGGDEMFVRAACPELVRYHADPADALPSLTALVDERSADESPTVLLRVDPDRSEAGAAHIVIVADDLDPDTRRRFGDLLGDPDLGVGGVLAGSGDHALVLAGDDDHPRARLDPEGVELRAHLIPAHTRAAIGTIFAATDAPADSPAPWWSDADNVRALAPRRESVRLDEREPEVVDHPYLRLLGPIDLLGAAGPAPTRARRQCEEYCGWLLENPRSVATQMASALVVAETTRRSNMSRLRSWLGSDAAGAPYLPEAYSGRIVLHPAVESDWRRIQVLTAPGLNRLAPESLIGVLELVRGAPLADAAPGQWRWAEELRTDMTSLIRDAGVLLVRWAVRNNDLDVARWAAARALLAAPEDELLLVERINTEVLAGNTAEVRRLVRWLTGQARALGVDLAPETVDACQRAMEGRPRSRAAH